MTAHGWDRYGLEVLDSETCLHLLTTVPIGRIGFCIDGVPVVLPVNFVLANPPGADAPAVVVRSGTGTKQAAALNESEVAFEIDSYDAFSHSGWSVLVHGPTRVLTEPADLEWAHALPLKPWAVRLAENVIVIDTNTLSGRRFGTHARS